MRSNVIILVTILSWSFCLSTFGQECVGGAIRTHDNYLYGRFETRMMSVGEDGVVSSFFLYNSDLDCNWPEENNEIDIEMTGDDEDVLFTTHYPGPWYWSDTWDAPFNPHTSMHDYVIEWEPGIVRWFVDGELVNVQDQDFVDGLIYPMRIHMNLWVAEAEGWVGIWDPAVMPVQSEYDYVRCYEYTPGTGNAGTGNNFTLLWEDEFDQLDEGLWEVSEYGGFGGNLCTFMPSSVEFEDGNLYLQLEEEIEPTELVPVTFSVDVSEEDMTETDVINLNGSFNDWCGNCAQMTENDGVWSLTVNLEPGEHQYLFTKNFWEENGGAPLGSECDYNPCDEWLNYGLIVSEGSDPIVLNTPCWGECESCITTGVISHSKKPKELIKICDLLGREVEYQMGHPLLYFYNDGSVEKRVGYD